MDLAAVILSPSRGVIGASFRDEDEKRIARKVSELTAGSQQHLRRWRLNGRALIERGRRADGVSMAVGNLPLAVLAPVDVGDAQRVRLSRDAFDGH